MVTNPDVLWIVITSGIACFFMAFVTGANDIANTFSTSIGSKAISVKKAIIVAFFFEALGASLLGGTVTDSIRSKIINFQVFYDAPQFLMLGMCCSLIGATIWLATATFAGIPVSTTHSIIGALMGFGLATGNMQSIKWEKIHSVIVSWFAAPLLAGTCSAIAFCLLRILVLRKNNSLSIIKKSYWFLIFLISLPFSVFLVFHNPIVINVECKMLKDYQIHISSPCYLQDWSVAHTFYASVICIFISICLTCIGSFIIYIIYNNRIKNYHMKKKIYGDEMLDLEKNGKNFCNIKNSSLNSVASSETQGTQLNAHIPSEIIEKKKDDHEKDYQNIMNIKKINFKNDLMEDKKPFETNNLPEVLIENFDPETEIVFSSLQIISAILGVIAQSANDTANAIGPFAAVFNTYNNGIKREIKVQWYILLFGGLSMSLGLSLFGYKVIKTVGMKLIKITPSRGFTIELISGLVVLFFSICGIPLSSTHCTVSSVIGVGLVEAEMSASKRKNLKILDNDSVDIDKDKNFNTVKKKRYFFSFLNTSCVNLKLFRTVFLSWIITVFFSGSVTAALFSFAAYSPSYKL